MLHHIIRQPIKSDQYEYEAPIIGCSKPTRVKDGIQALEVTLTAEEVAYLEEPYVAHELVGPLARPGEKPLAGTTDPNA